MITEVSRTKIFLFLSFGGILDAGGMVRNESMFWNHSKLNSAIQFLNKMLLLNIFFRTINSQTGNVSCESFLPAHKFSHGIHQCLFFALQK